MKNNIEYIKVWSGWLILSHVVIGTGVLFQLFSAFALRHGHIDYDFWYDWHLMIGQAVLIALGLRLALLFIPGSSHWRALIPRRSRLSAMRQMLIFYLSLARAPLPNWFAHSPLWQPLYLLILPVLLAACITGLMHETQAGAHATLASIIALFSLFHILSVCLHDWKARGASISAMLSGMRYFHQENEIQNSLGSGQEIRISVDSIGRKKADQSSGE